MSAPTSVTTSSDAAGHIVAETITFADHSRVQINNVFSAGHVASSVAVTGANGSTTTLNVTGTAGPSVLLAGSGQTVTGGGAGSTSILIGDGGSKLMGGAGVAVMIGLGAGDAVTGGAGAATVLLAGDNETVFDSAGPITAYLEGASDTATLNNGATLVIGGTYDTATAGTNVTAYLQGTGDVVAFGTGATVVVTGSQDSAYTQGGSTAWITGAGATVNMGTGSYASVGGANAIVTSSGGSISVAAGITATLNTSYDTVNVAANANVTVVGVGDQINASTADTIVVTGTVASGNANTVTVTGTGTGVTMSGGTLNVTAGSTAFLNGNHDSVSALANTTVGMLGDDNYIQGGAGAVINVGGSRVGVVMSGGTLNVNPTSLVYLTGNRNIVGGGQGTSISALGDFNVITAAPADVITVGGNGDIVGMSNGTLNVNTGSSATVNGNQDNLVIGSNVTLGVSGSTETITSGGPGDVVNLGGYNSSATVTMSGGALNVGAGSSASLAGNQDNLTANQGSATIAIVGNGDVFTGVTSDIVTSGGTYNTVAIAGHSTISGSNENQNVSVGAGGETATVIYDTVGNQPWTSQDAVFDEQGREVFSAQVLRIGNPSIFVPSSGWNTSPSAYTFYSYNVDKWGHTTPAGPVSSENFSDSHGDSQQTLFNYDGTLKAVQNIYADKTQDISMFGSSKGTLSSFTATFGSNGIVQNIIESTGVLGGQSTLVTVTGAEILQSLQNVGTSTFIENGIKLLLVNSGTVSGSASTTSMYWQSISQGSASASAAPSAVTSNLGFAPEAAGISVAYGLHFIGEAIAGYAFGNLGAALGGAIGITVGAIVGSVVPGLGTVAGAEAGFVVGRAGGVIAGGVIGGDWGGDLANQMQQSGSVSFDPNQTSAPPMY